MAVVLTQFACLMSPHRLLASGQIGRTVGFQTCWSVGYPQGDQCVPSARFFAARSAPFVEETAIRRSPQVPSCCETNGSAMNSSWPGGPEYGGHVKVSFDLVSVQFWKALCLTTESSCSNQFVDYTFCRRRKQFHDSAPASFTTLVTPGLVRWMEV